MSPQFPHDERSLDERRRTLLRKVTATMLLACAALGVQTATAQQLFPDRPITLIIPFPPGGTTDSQFRALATAASKELGQPIVIANQPGVGGTLGPVTMARNSAPDGYTLAALPATLYRLPHLMKAANWNPLEDFTYIIGLTSYSFGIAVAADSPWNSLEELLADAKARPNQIAFASTGAGGTGHIGMSQLLKAEAAQMIYVPFKGVELVTAVIGGHVQVMSEAGWGAQAKAGKLHMLALMNEERAKNWPEVPTLKELGYDITALSMLGIGGPKGMDPAVVKKLHDAFLKASNDGAYQDILDMENQPFIHLDSAAYARAAAEQFEKDGQAVKDLGIEMQ